MVKYSIAMVAACPFPANYGSPASIREMSETLAGMGHDVHIVTYPYGHDIPTQHAKIHRVEGKTAATVKVGPTDGKLLLDFRMVKLLHRIVREKKIQVIHAHNYEGALIGLVVHFLTGVPMIYNAVNTMADELPSYGFIRPAFLAPWVARFLDWFVPIFPNHITAVSEELRQWLIRRGAREDRVTLVPAGIIPAMFEKADAQKMRRRHDLEDHPLVLYTGTLGKFQRIDYLIKAFAFAVRQEPNARLLILHPLAEDQTACREQAAALGISEKVIWVGPHPLEELPDYLAMADVAVVPRTDCPGHPVKLLNYMMAACPIVCFAGSAKYVRHGESAYLAPDHDCDALGQGIVELLRDRTQALNLGQNAKKAALTSFDWCVICCRIERIYESLIKASFKWGIADKISLGSYNK